MNSKLRFNSKMVFLVLLTMLLVPVAFAGWTDFFKGGMTGWASKNHTATVVIGTGSNIAPNVTFVSNVSITTLESQATGPTTNITFWFIGYDINAVSDLDDTSATANFSFAGETARTNLSCRWISDVNAADSYDGYSANYSCNVEMWFYDRPGAWTINVTINDSSDARAYNASKYTTIPALVSINMTPTSLNWTNLAQGATNQNATTSINVSNDGNQNLTNITIKAYELIGQGSASAFKISAANFTVGNDTTTKCLGTQPPSSRLVNDTEQNVTAWMASYGKGATMESIYYCIPLVPDVAYGIYNTTNMWVVSTERND